MVASVTRSKPAGIEPILRAVVCSDMLKVISLGDCCPEGAKP